MHHHHRVGEDPVEHAASSSDRTGGAGPAVAALAAVLAYGTWAVSLPPFSGAATAAVLAGGSAAVLWGATRGRRTGTREPPAPVWPWAVVAAAIAIWQLAAYLQTPRAEHPTISSLTNALLDSHPARAIAFVAWVLVAGWLARR